MKIWIDGDNISSRALTAALKSAEQAGVVVEIVADRHLHGLTGEWFHFTVVGHGSGRTDTFIEKNSQPQDLVLTRDLILAKQLTVRGIRVMNDRGRVWTEKSLTKRIEDAIIMRAMKEGGMVSRQKSAYSHKDVQQFSQALNRLLAENKTPGY